MQNQDGPLAEQNKTKGMAEMLKWRGKMFLPAACALKFVAEPKQKILTILPLTELHTSYVELLTSYVKPKLLKTEKVKKNNKPVKKKNKTKLKTPA